MKKSKIQVVSSRWTFFLKLAFPFLWAIFMGGVTIIILLSTLQQVQKPFDPLTAKLLVGSFYLSTLGIFYLLFLRIKWVGMTPTHLYVSNFFRSYKYTYDSVERFEETNILLYKRITIHFHDKTKFGKTIFFIRSHYFRYFLEKHPAVLATLLAEDNTNNTGIEESQHRVE